MMRIRPLLALLFLLGPANAGHGAGTTLEGTARVAPVIALGRVAPLTFGVIDIPAVVPGYFEIDPVSNSGSGVNAIQLATASRGTFSISGRAGVNVTLTAATSGLTCDTSYMNPCQGTDPTISNLVHTFPGQISATDCTGARCTDLVYVGARLNFLGPERGRWTGSIAVTANYQ
jgi:hypothetical protein